MLVNDEVLLDYGIKTGDIPEYPLNSMEPKVVLISHGHLDHCGAVPNLMYQDPEVFMTPPTADFTFLLGKDTLKLAESTLSGVAPFDPDDLQKLARRTQKIDCGETFKSHGYRICFYNAGHIPGASGIFLESESGESLFYTGDFNLKETRLVPGAAEFPETDTLILESTYFGEEHIPRKETEERFIESVLSTLDIGGTALIPAFAIGRTQEILMLLDAHGIQAYVDGMGRDVYKILKKYPEYLKNPELLDRAFGRAIPVKNHQRDSVLKEPSVIVTTAGMLNGGPVLYYLSRLYKDPSSKVLLTGYQVEGTNGRLALEHRMIETNGDVLALKPRVEQYDFSAHSGDSELKKLVKDFCRKGTERIFVMHGDKTESFAQWISEEIGVDAYAPANGESFTF
ncbi:universal archaeal KH-domain/beta-lactamase-domain protein [Methanosarcina barkeri str. Wiesmoor]|uniref:Universal archaeal KH-domain/beta-lactamase-domain protein n=2 Tax=Methanosarcina barkeri TaxID=2208 RepID=A0A0E3QM41_METBA|nr:universal archaeal KH-domain/beta-lactamase-domain protein [Methanosarcina barkeri str. Wiesmoor]